MNRSILETRLCEAWIITWCVQHPLGRSWKWKFHETPITPAVLVLFSIFKWFQMSMEHFGFVDRFVRRWLTDVHCHSSLSILSGPLWNIADLCQAAGSAVAVGPTLDSKVHIWLYMLPLKSPRVFGHYFFTCFCFDLFHSIWSSF